MTRQTKYHEMLLKNYKKLARYPKELHLRYDNFFQKFHHPVFITDTKGCFVFFNECAEKFTGYSKHDVEGHHFRMLFTLDDLNDGFLFFYQTMRGCYSEHTRFRIRLKDGSTKVIDVLAAPIVFDGKVQGVLAIAHDISGKNSDERNDQERTIAFKKFSRDLDAWDERHQTVRKELKDILSKISKPNL